MLSPCEPWRLLQHIARSSLLPFDDYPCEFDNQHIITGSNIGLLVWLIERIAGHFETSSLKSRC